MIKEIVFASILQMGDVGSTIHAEKHRKIELNPLMQGSARYPTSAMTIAGTAYGLSKIKNKKVKILVCVGLVIGKGLIIRHNLK